MSIPNPIQDNRYLQTNKVDDQGPLRKVERRPDGPPKGRPYKEAEESAAAAGPKKVKTPKYDPDGEAKPVNIFDLSANSQTSGDDESPSDDLAMGSIEMTAAMKKSQNLSDTMAADSFTLEEDNDGPVAMVSSKTNNDANQSALTASALAGMNQHVSTSSSVSANTLTSVPRVDLQEIVDQITNKIYTLKAGDKADTTIDFQFPIGHKFEGMKVAVTSYESAPHEYNISFTNLSQEGKNFFDAQGNMDGLKQILDARGVIVHMVVPTTLASTPIMAENAELKREKGQEDQQNPGQPKKQK